MLILELGQTRAISLRTRLLPSPQTFKYTPNISSLDPWKDRLSIYPIILFPWYSNNSLNIIYVDNFYSILSVTFRKRVDIFPIQFSLQFLVKISRVLSHNTRIQNSRFHAIARRKSRDKKVFLSVHGSRYFATRIVSFWWEGAAEDW